jgi:hypothetical protein
MSHGHHVAAFGAVLSAAGAVAVTTLTAGVAHADRPVGDEVAVVLTTGDVSPFTSVLTACASGTVVNDQVRVQFTKPQGIFNGSRCSPATAAREGSPCTSRRGSTRTGR